MSAWHGGKNLHTKRWGGRVVGMGGVQKQMNEAEIASILFLQWLSIFKARQIAYTVNFSNKNKV